MTVRAIYNGRIEGEEVTNYTTEPAVGTPVPYGLEKVTVSYEGKTAEILFTTNGGGGGDNPIIPPVQPKELDRIEIDEATIPQKTYYAGDTFNKEGMVVKAIYNNGDVITLDKENYQLEPATLEVGITSVTISYEDKIATIRGINVLPITLDYLSIEHEPWKIEYSEGETFDPDGMIILAHYNNGNVIKVDDYELSPSVTKPLITRVNEITISYQGKEIKQPITVYAQKVRLVSIEVTGAPYKTVYYEGEPLRTDGMIVMATYSNGDVRSLNETEYEALPNRDLELGDTEIIINFEDNGIIKRTTYPITVNPIPEEELYIYVDNYEEVQDGDITYLEGLQPNKPVKDVLSQLRTNGRIRVYYANGNVVSDYETYMATEMRIVFTKGEYRKEYVLIVRGDVNADGEADFRDMLRINKHRLNKVRLEGACLKAGNVNSDYVVDFNDMLKINKFRLGKMKAL